MLQLELAEQRKMEGMRKHVAGRFAKGESDRLVKRLRQERLRQNTTGITQYSWATKANVMVIPVGNELYVLHKIGQVQEQ